MRDPACPFFRAGLAAGFRAPSTSALLLAGAVLRLPLPQVNPAQGRSLLRKTAAGGCRWHRALPGPDGGRSPRPTPARHSPNPTRSLTHHTTAPVRLSRPTGPVPSTRCCPGRGLVEVLINRRASAVVLAHDMNHGWIAEGPAEIREHLRAEEGRRRWLVPTPLVISGSTPIIRSGRS